MPFRLIADANAQTTVPGALTAGASSVVVAASANFSSPQSFGNGQGTLTILDGGNAGWNPNLPFATPFEYATYTNNNTGTNTLSGLTRGVAGTTGHSFFAGAIVAQGMLAEDFVASTPWKFDEQTPSGVASITIPASGAIPASYLGVPFRHILIKWSARTTSANGGDSLLMTINGDAGAHYAYQLRDSVGASVTTSLATGQTSTLAGTIAGGTTAANFTNTGSIEFESFYATTTNKKGWFRCCRNDGLAAGIREAFWEWQQLAAITSITLSAASGSFANALFTTYLWP